MSKKRKPLETGYYWVKWSYARSDSDIVERIGYYNARLQTWTIDGDLTRYHSSNFIGIDENRIPRYNTLQPRVKVLLWVALGLFIYQLVWIGFDIYKLITLITK